MTMGPYPEVPHALYRQREQYRLAIFINSRDDLIASTVAAIGASFGYVITAEQAGAYKPSRECSNTRTGRWMPLQTRPCTSLWVSIGI